MRYLKDRAVKQKVHESGKQITKDGLYALDVKVDDFIQRIIKERNGGHGRIDAKLVNLFKLCLAFFLFMGVACANPADTKAGNREKIVSIARAEIGRGEEWGNNKGKWVRTYLAGKEDLPWCAGFVSYVLKRSGVKDFGYQLSARAFYNKAKKCGLITNKPKAGDLIVFWRGSKNSCQGHIGIIERIDAGKIITIEGNVGKYPAKVKRITYKAGNIPQLLGFINIGAI